NDPETEATASELFHPQCNIVPPGGLRTHRRRPIGRHSRAKSRQKSERGGCVGVTPRMRAPGCTRSRDPLAEWPQPPAGLRLAAFRRARSRFSSWTTMEVPTKNPCTELQTSTLHQVFNARLFG